MLLLTVVISTTLLVTKVLHLMMLVCSIALTFHYRWFVRWVRTPSSLRSDLRLVTEWLRTHSHRVLLKDLVFLQRTQTVTTDVLLLKT